jgi:hypothetical protein
MRNNNAGQKKGPEKFSEIIFLKVLIIFVIALIPLSFMLLDLSKKFFVSNQQNKIQSIGSEENIRVALPAGTEGDINQVPKEKIDSLFNNLKK